MKLDPNDTKALDIVLEAFHTRATQDGRTDVADSFNTIREHLTHSAGELDPKLVMDIQTLLMPLLDSEGDGSPPETIKKRLRTIFGSMDQGRPKQ